MTLPELIRAIESKKRMMKLEAQERASFDYILADLIGRSVARIHSSANKMPKIYEAYPALFDANEVNEQTRKKNDERITLQFKQFVASFNAKFMEVNTEQ